MKKFFCSLCLFLLSCQSLSPPLSLQSPVFMNLQSPAFQNQASIPALYTCDDQDVNPPLQISEVPSEAKSLVLIVDDPDAPRGDWVHWLLWNIDPATAEILENSVPTGAVQGLTDFGNNEWGGPCPPSGTHRYFFKLYVLDTILDISASNKKTDLEAAMKNHILEQTQLIGLYQRQ